MKKLLLSIFGFMAAMSMFGQDVVIIGLNADGPDQFSFVATADIDLDVDDPTVIYFTDEVYKCSTGKFANNGKGKNAGVLSFTLDIAPLLNGDIVSIQYNNSTSSWDVITGQGTTVEVANDLNLQLQTGNGDHLYAFTASSVTDPSGNVTGISSVVETRGGTMPASQDPTCDYPAAVVIDFTTHFDNFDYTRDRGLETTIANLATIGNYTQDDNRIATSLPPAPPGLNVAPFTNSALPVELISFEAKLVKKNEVSLTWFTGSEENNSHFEIEHSTNGRDFVAIGIVKGIGTSSEKQQYSYTHEKVMPGKNYYRLRQVDFDGAFEYSNVVAVKLRGAGTVQIRPTLADQQVSLLFDEAIRQEAQLQVFDIAGRQISTALVSPGTEQFELPVADFTKGMYFIQLALNGDVSTLKFIKR